MNPSSSTFVSSRRRVFRKRPSAPGILVVGSANTDLVIRSERLPSPGETVADGVLRTLPGGKGANQAVAAARAGAQVTFVANIGRDRLGDQLIHRLDQEGVETGGVERHPTEASGTALILLDRRGQSLISVASGSNGQLNANQVRRAVRGFRKARWRCVLAQMEVPLTAVGAAMDVAVQAGIPFLLNPAPAQPLPKSWYHKLDCLIPNEFELEVLSGTRCRSASEIEKAGKSLHRRGVKWVLVTCGERGVCAVSKEGVRWFAAPRVKAVDTVGAGDCFCGVLATLIAEGSSWTEAIEGAVRAASLSVTRTGAQDGLPYRHEFLKSKIRGKGLSETGARRGSQKSKSI